MNILDFIIGLTLVNSLFHFTLGTWKQRMLSGFGYGNQQNIIYALLNFSISIGLFLYQYGLSGLTENGIYTGVLTMVVIQLLTGKFWYNLFKDKE
jgi:hypothetical protein